MLGFSLSCQRYLKIEGERVMDKKRILVVGSGGREHAILWKLRQSRRVGELFSSQANAGIAQIAEDLKNPVETAEDVARLVEQAKTLGIDITIVGSDKPLELGVVDAFQDAGLAILGPTRDAAQIEWDKVFAKYLMVRNNIPTAPFTVFTELEPALRHVHERRDLPFMVKASRLARGQGALKCKDESQAVFQLERILKTKSFGEDQAAIVEKCLTGSELSVTAITDGESFQTWPYIRDYKKLLDGDKGGNCGSMGAWGPASLGKGKFLIHRQVKRRVVEPVLRALRVRGRTFVGWLYPGIMVNLFGVKVLEFNARLGNPEAQVLMRRLRTDLLDIVEAILARQLKKLKIEWHRKYAVCVVMATEGYPQADEDEYPKASIEGLHEAAKVPTVVVFHGGTMEENNVIYTAGGRPLSVTALGDTLVEARERVYDAVEWRISCPKLKYRLDIAQI